MSFLKASILRIDNVEGLFVSVPCVFEFILAFACC
jgi:hypothetical protein